ncbi:MAG: hypothetical protein BGO82_13675 [Devosia sp. 67-54]|nr:MAG: hypothetical protein BGO82_13675 [Devosia sp. 67-54]
MSAGRRWRQLRHIELGCKQQRRIELRRGQQFGEQRFQRQLELVRRQWRVELWRQRGSLELGGRQQRRWGVEFRSGIGLTSTRTGRRCDGRDHNTVP